MKLEYKYDTNSTSYDNNGSMREQKVTVPTANGTAGFTATQTYSYDALNRLGSAEETIAGSTTLKQTFEIDRYGNRRFDTSTSGLTTTLGSCTTICNPTFDATNNRITSSGFSFDSSGNTTRDAADRKFTYDAENKQTKAETLSAGTNTVTGTIGEYSYDGDGRRVKKYVPSIGETTIFVYDAAGKQIAEYSTVVASANDAKVAYLTADHLGSPRINTDVTGAVTSRHDYHPFGEEIAATGSRSTSGYVGDAVRKQFTGYERDNETDLDFAQARYYNKSHGRFTSADEPFADQDENDPQTWNLYAYSRNNPLRYSDPTGEGFWTKLWNYINYSVWGEEEDVQKSEDLKRQWLSENKFYQQAPDGTWYPIDPTNMNRDDVWYFYNKYQLAIAEDRMVQLTPEQQAAANILPSISTAPPGATTTTKNLGPSGKVSTQKYLEENWEKSTFGSVKKTIAYHLKEHGKGLTAVKYTQRAIKAFNDAGAVKSAGVDKLGREAVRVVSKYGEGLFTPKGKIIWFHPK